MRTGRCRSRTESQKEVRRQTTRCDKWSVVDFLVLVNVRQFAAKDVLGRDGRGKFQEGCSSVSSWGENCGTGDETVLWCRLLLLGEQKFMGLNVPKRGGLSLTENGRGRAAFSSMGAACLEPRFAGREWPRMAGGRLH